MQKVNLKILAAVCVFMMTLAVPAGAVTHYVSEGQSIQAAIDDANDYDEIEVAPGTYNEAINFLGKAVRLYSNGGPILTEIAGFYEHLHVVQCVSGEGPGTILEGFTITGGNATGTGGPDFNGGGMLNDGSSPTVTNCTFSGNWADYGGGMYNGYGSYPTVTDCIFQNNTAYVWGAGMFNNQSNPTVTNCTFLNNNASWDGGGMFNELSSPTVIDCNFINNIAAHSGGGMYSKNDSNSIVNNCTFSGNEARGYTANMGGGGMYNLDNSSPMVTDCEFTGNTTVKSGGGMYSKTNSNPTVENCTFSGNSSGSYGGGMCNDQSSPMVTDCNFSSNLATTSIGGGMHNRAGSDPTVTDCNFTGNSASQAGGMFNDSSSPAVTNSTFSSNSATGIGGGMYNFNNSSPTVTNCTFSGNSAGTDGGGMDNRVGSNPTVTSCTFSNNSATGYGGGIDNYDSNPTVTNCILWGDEPNEISNNSPTLTVTYSDVQGGWVGTGNIDVDPCFVDANNPNPNLWNLRLQPDSPCIDAGDTTAVSLPLDLDGNPRAIDNPHTPNTGLSVSDSLNVVDMGAYEFQPCRIAGDINCDGVVDFKDLAILAGNWLAGVGD